MQDPPAPSAVPTTFLARAQEVTSALTARPGLPTWFATRVVDDTYTLLVGDSLRVQVPVGIAVPWAHTACEAMVAGLGPQVALDIGAVPTYAERPLVQRFGIRTYTGVPMRTADGRLLGTLCGVGPQPLDADGYRNLAPAREEAARLAAALEADLRALAGERGEDSHRALRHRDDVTGLPDRRSWGRLLAREEERARSHAEPSTVAVVDLGAAHGVRSLRRAAAAALEAAGADAVVARLNARQLGVLCAGRPARGAAEVCERVRLAVRASGSTAVAGTAAREATGGLSVAWQRAELGALAVRRGADA
ncbi:GAF domain-containing protein [Kineococcus sp. SYSU DK005]|uniref:GAF domain-containing protein n=1 Tax=Kineococcus sp. SYSU DK005 TaxID=3383126 RepID=UPI003D7EDFEA